MFKLALFLCLLHFPVACYSEEYKNLECPQKEARPQIVAITVSAYSSILSTMLQGISEITVCVPSGASAHTWEPKPNDTLCLQKATLWFGTGEPFEPKLLAITQEQNKTLRFVDLRKGIEPLYEDTCCAHDHGQGLTIDPHIWLSPKQLVKQLETIEIELKATFPEKAHLLSERAAKLRASLLDLDAYIRRTLGHHKGSYVVASHAAYGYFCREYGLIQLAIEKEGKEPTVQELLNLVDQAKKKHVHTIFIQKQYPSRAAEQIATQLNAHIKELDPYAKDYFKDLLEITTAIHEEAQLQHE